MPRGTSRARGPGDVMDEDLAQDFAAATAKAFEAPLPGDVRVRQVEDGEAWRVVFEDIHAQALGARPSVVDVWSADERGRFAALRAAAGAPV